MTALVFILATITMTAQERYVEEIFTDVQVTADVVYGMNGTILTLPSQGEIVPQELLLDIYQPVGDTETERPLVLVFHAGNFLPPVINGEISGSKSDNSAIEICTQLAKRGFVAASVDYRLGWNPFANSQPEKALGLIQAIFRSAQDGHTAIRFFNQTYNDGNAYGINPEKITCWGNGRGGAYTVLGMNGLNDYNEIVTTTNGPDKFLMDWDMDMVPETPMVASAYHGDIYGEITAVAPDDAYGFPAGDTSNYTNHVGQSNDFHLTVSIGGAIGDISWLSDQEVPIIAIQSPNDFFVPYDDGPLIIPTGGGELILRVQGLKQIGAVQDASGINQPWKDQVAIDAITQKAIDNSATAGHPYYEGAFPWVKPENSNGYGEGVVLNWWNPNDPSPMDSPGMGTPWNALPHPSGGTYHDQGLFWNEGMSAEKARANIAEVMAYVIPRACVTLDLGCSILGTEDVNLDDQLVAIAPNPATGSVTVAVTNAEQLQQLAIYNMDGGLVHYASNIDDNNTTVELNNLPTGIYVVKAYLANGVVAKRLLVK